MYHWEKRLKERGLTRGFTEREKQGVLVPLLMANSTACEEPECSEQLPEKKGQVLLGQVAATEVDHDPAERIDLTTADGMKISLPTSTSIFFLLQFINGLRKINC